MNSHTAAAHAEYDATWGEPRPGIIYDWTYRCYRAVLVRQLRGPGDGGAVANPHAQLRAERLPHNNDPRRHAQRLALARMRREECAMEQVADALAAGPLSLRRLNPLAPGVGFARLGALLRARPDRFVFLGGKTRLWGLVGVDYARALSESDSPLSERIAQMVERYGPLTVAELSHRLGSQPSRITKTITLRRDLYVAVGVRKGRGSTRDSTIWGLA